MSKSGELTRKDMKEPDQFQVVAGQAASWLKGHGRPALVAGGVTVLVLVVALVITSLRERSAAAAGALLSDVYKAAGGEISSIPLPGLPGPFFATDAARQKAVLEAAAKVLAQYPATRAAAMASLAKGDAHLRLGEWDAAASAYQGYLAAAGKDDPFRFGALEGLALVAEAKGGPDGALAAWARLAAEVPAQSDRADLEKARVLAAAGKMAEARQLLTAFGEAHKGSPLAGEAAERLSKLGGK
jgi:tetratricopeptide (TPR) repeat protein